MEKSDASQTRKKYIIEKYLREIRDLLSKDPSSLNADEIPYIVDYFILIDLYHHTPETERKFENVCSQISANWEESICLKQEYYQEAFDFLTDFFDDSDFVHVHGLFHSHEQKFEKKNSNSESILGKRVRCGI